MEFRALRVRPGYDLWAPTYDDSPNPVLFVDARHTIDVLAPAAGERILDAGCGTGRNIAALRGAGARPVGLDFSPPMLDLARSRFPDVEIVEGDLSRPLPFASGEFDAVLCALLFEHLTDPETVLHGIAAVLRPGGRAVLSMVHPRLVAAGVQAQFVREGIGYRIESHPHGVDDYLRWIRAAGLTPEPARELPGGPELVDAMPFTGWMADLPVLLVLRAVREQNSP